MAPSQMLEAIRSMRQNVDMHVGGMRYAQGMQEATRLQPADSEELRQDQLKALVSVLGALKSESAIKDSMKELTPDMEDNLMKLVYYGLSKGDASLSVILFKVHEALTKKAGLGCIVRAVCTRYE